MDRLPTKPIEEIFCIQVGTNSQLQVAIISLLPLAKLQMAAWLEKHNKPRSFEYAIQTLLPWLKERIKYQTDTGEDQIVKLPSALAKVGKGDCKSFSLLAGGLLAALGRPVVIRFTSYNPADSTPTHVYVLDELSGMAIDMTLKDIYSELPYIWSSDFRYA